MSVGQTSDQKSRNSPYIVQYASELIIYLNKSCRQWINLAYRSQSTITKQHLK